MFEPNWVQFVYYFFSFSSGIVNNILSHMCRRLYFPMFLFRVGLLTLINMASCMVLATLFPSLPMILKLSIDVLWPLVFWWLNIGEGVFKCSLNLSPKGSPRLSYVFFNTTLGNIFSIDYILLYILLSLYHTFIHSWWDEWVMWGSGNTSRRRWW